MGARLKFWRRAVFQKKGVKSHSTNTQYRQLRRLVSESWLSMTILSRGLCYGVRKDRARTRIGGGVAIICRNDWKGKAVNVTDSLEFESLAGDHVV